MRYSPITVWPGTFMPMILGRVTQDQVDAASKNIRDTQARMLLWRRPLGVVALIALWFFPSIPLAALVIAWIIWTEAANIIISLDHVDVIHRLQRRAVCETLELFPALLKERFAIEFEKLRRDI